MAGWPEVVRSRFFAVRIPPASLNTSIILSQYVADKTIYNKNFIFGQVQCVLDFYFLVVMNSLLETDPPFFLLFLLRPSLKIAFWSDVGVILKF